MNKTKNVEIKNEGRNKKKQRRTKGKE
jgi:hypothetical protein